MKNTALKIVASLLTASTAALTLSILAATSAGASTVTNSYSNEWTNGTRNLDVQNVRTEVGTVYSVDQGIKCETFGGDVNTCSVDFDGTSLTGSGYSANLVPVDPTAIITTVKTVTNSSYTDSTVVNLSEVSNFTGHTYTHSVSAE